MHKAMIILSVAVLALCYGVNAANENWFSGGASGANVTASDASWNNELPSGVAVANSKISLENDYASRLTLTPAATNPQKSDGLVSLDFTVTVDATDSSSLPQSSELSGAKIGFTVATDNDVKSYYGYANGSWIKLDGSTPPNEGNITATIVVDYRGPSVQFKIGQTVLYSASDNTVNSFAISGSPSSTTATAGVDFFGAGSVTSVSAQYEIAAAQGKDGLKYATIAEAASKSGAGNIVTYDGSGNAEDLTAANSWPTWICKGMGLSISDSSATYKAVAVDSDTANDGITLKVDNVEHGLPIKFKVYNVDSSSYVSDVEYEADAIKLPLATGRYKVVVDY